jgi:putative IMPACT (imprinted ancient) family translation regulator
MLTFEGLTNTALIVTRYFGGVKLGTGGLARAYAGVARSAIDAAGICEVRETVLLTYRVDYGFFEKLRNLARRDGAFGIDGAAFTDAVTATLSGPSEDEAALGALVADITAGSGELLKRETRLTAIPRDSRDDGA